VRRLEARFLADDRTHFIWFAPDGDKAGERHAQSLLALVSLHCFVRRVKMEEGKQPMYLSEQLKNSFTT